MNPFEVFGLEPHFFLDLKKLENLFYSLSHKLHPDRIQASGDPTAVDNATFQTAQLNQAYGILKNNESRASSLFEILGMKKASEKKQIPLELAEEYFDLLEKVEHLDLVKRNAKLQEFAEKVSRFERDLSYQLDGAFKAWEKAGKPQGKEAERILGPAKEALDQTSYVKSLSEDLLRRWSA